MEVVIVIGFIFLFLLYQLYKEQQESKGKADVFANVMKKDFKSKNPTTRWSDIIKIH